MRSILIIFKRKERDNMKDIIDIETRSKSFRFLNEPCGIFEKKCYEIASHGLITKEKAKKTFYELSDVKTFDDVTKEHMMIM